MFNLLDIFAEADKKSNDSLFVVHNDSVEMMTVADIFDTKRYTDFKAVSYVSSPQFFSEVVKDFQTVTFILGIDNSENLTKFSDGISAYLDNRDNVEFFNNLPDEVKNSIVEDNFQIRYGKPGVMIHDKIYLLANENTSDYRVVIGSANFSKSAFNPDNLNFENVRIDDSKKLYDLYLIRFKYLLEQTIDYIPERSRKTYKNKNLILQVTPETNVELLVESLEKKNFQLVVTEEQRDILIERQEKVADEQSDIERTLKVIEVITESKSKNGIFPLKKNSQIAKSKSKLQEIFYKVPKIAKKDESDCREILLTKGDCRIYKKFDEQSDEVEIYSKKIDKDKIKSTLEKINAFTQAYYDFAVTPNPIIPSKIYEMILYAFTAPFIWKIRQKCAMNYGKVLVADIPLFCIIGGISGSGKSTALRFVANLMGQRGKQIYEYAKELDRAGIIYGLITSNNLMPIFADEVGLSFFKGSNSQFKGEAMIKSLANDISNEPTGTFIGTTNAPEFSASEQVIRRIYYLEVSSKFEKKNIRNESTLYRMKIYDELDDELFKDFTFRFSDAIRNNEEIFTIDDFLSLTRKIFLSYYNECAMDVPNYFPHKIFSDYKNKKVDTWRKLFFGNKDCFIIRDKEIQVNIDEIFRNSTNAKNQKEMLLNFLDETCLETTLGVGVNWFLKKEEFYKFIGYEPTTFEKTKNFLQKIFANS